MEPTAWEFCNINEVNNNFRYDANTPNFLYEIKLYSDLNASCLNNENIRNGQTNSTLGVTCSGDYNNYIDTANQCSKESTVPIYNAGTGVNTCLGNFIVFK